MSRILTPKGWKELEELTEHKANKPHKHPHKPYGPFEKEEVEEKYTDAQRAAKEKSRVGDRMHGGSGVVGKEKGGDTAFFVQ